jgi:hypothetical protein
MAGKTAQSRSPRDADGGRAQRCVPSGREFWRRRRVREECRRAPLVGGGRGKFSGAGTAVPATAIGIQPCNRERCPTGERRAVAPCRYRPTPGQIPAARSALSMPVYRGPRPARKRPRWICGSLATVGCRTDRTPAENPQRTQAGWQDSSANGPGTTRTRPAGFQPRRRERRSDQRRARASPEHRHTVTPTVWCAIAC